MCGGWLSGSTQSSTWPSPAGPWLPGTCSSASPWPLLRDAALAWSSWPRVNRSHVAQNWGGCWQSLRASWPETKHTPGAGTGFCGEPSSALMARAGDQGSGGWGPSRTFGRWPPRHWRWGGQKQEKAVDSPWPPWRRGHVHPHAVLILCCELSSSHCHWGETHK